MRDAFRVPIAIAVGVLVATAAAFGGVMFVDDDVHTLDGAADSFVQESEAFIGIGTAAAIAFVGGAVAHEVLTDDASVNQSALDELDAQETKISLYNTASTKGESNGIFNDSMGNYLEDTRSIALMEGKNAYIKSLNNDSSESVAENAATEAVADYYAVKQQQLIAQWNTSLTLWSNSRQIANNTTNVGVGYVDYQHAHGYGDGAHNPSSGTFTTEYRGVMNSTVDLVNASTATPMALDFWLKNHLSDSDNVDVYINNVETIQQDNDRAATALGVEAPNENYDRVEIVDFSDFTSRWSEVQAQNDAVQAELSTFIDGTYEEYQAGEINSSDLVDPYLGAREFSPEGEFNSWALTSMTSMGIEPPENLSNVGEMEVTDLENDITYTGILMSQETPEGGYALDTTYNASEINGTQMVVTEDDNSHELTGEFVVDSATNADGEEYAENESITYRDITYETTNTSEYQDLMQNLTEMQAQIEANQQQERSGGGGGLFPGFGLGGIGGVGGVALLAAAGGAFLLARD